MSEYLKEEWRWMLLEDVISGRYKISNYGRVKDTGRDAFVSPVITGVPQYWYVNLVLPCGKRTLKRVHRLLAQVFINNPNNRGMVDHEDRNKYNNCIDNLRWVTRSQNQMNRDCTNIFKGMPLKHYCEANFEQPTGAYAYLLNSIRFHDLTEDESLEKYSNYLEYGLGGNKKISVRGEEKLLHLFLDELGLTPEEYHRRSRIGLSDEDIEKGYKFLPPLEDNSNSRGLEVGSSVGDICYYFPNKTRLAESINVCVDTINTRIEAGCKTWQDFRDWNYIDANFQYTFEGFTGTLRQLADKYNLRYETARDRLYGKRWSLEKTLTTKRMKIRHYICDGIKLTKKQVWEKFLPESSVKNWNSMHCRTKLSLKEFLLLKGADVSKISIEPCI
mgnify:CR=1 FL=1|tara:strand:- start:3421 stop:4584 length:1164 start_codon:yes stop_codon:yes gene_type:complete